ncbi:hypothetical protein TcasGA2_TC031826, partial [Tribolium castaneum]
YKGITVIDEATVSCCDNVLCDNEVNGDDEDHEFLDAISELATDKTIDIRIFHFVIKQKNALIKELHGKINLLNKHIEWLKNPSSNVSNHDNKEKETAIEAVMATASTSAEPVNNNKVPMDKPKRNAQNKHRATKSTLGDDAETFATVVNKGHLVTENVNPKVTKGKLPEEKLQKKVLVTAVTGDKETSQEWTSVVRKQGEIDNCCALEKISTWQDSKTANDAYCLLQTLRSSDFIISSICLSDVLGATVSLSRILQSNSIDLKKAADAINDTISVLQNKRENADVIYRQLFEEAKEVAGQLDVEIKCPRIVSRQIHRANNQPAQSAEEQNVEDLNITELDPTSEMIPQLQSQEATEIRQNPKRVKSTPTQTRKPKQPPIIIKSAITKPLNTQFKILYLKNETKIYTEEKEARNLIINQLTHSKINFYTFTPKDEKTYKIVLKAASFTTIEEIETTLGEHEVYDTTCIKLKSCNDYSQSFLISTQ